MRHDPRSKRAFLTCKGGPSMNRTSKLMTAVTTSLLLTGPLPGTSATPSASAIREESQSDESWKSDPQVQEAANTIVAWLSDTRCEYNDDQIDKSKTKAQSQIAQQFPQFSSGLLQNALQYAQWENWVKRIGDGSTGSPFRYCRVLASHG